MTLERLTRCASQLDEAQLNLLCEMADAFGKPFTEELNPRSDLVSDGFRSYMLNRLLMHHATSSEKYNKTSFEHAFVSASRFAGRHAEKTAAHTYQGADVVVDGVRWSLKTEAAAEISPRYIVISKFSEARWIRECQTGDEFAEQSIGRIEKHLSEYDRILTLRAFSVDTHNVRYDLVEIPHDLLALARNLRAVDFKPRTRNGSSSAVVHDDDGRPAFTLVLDGSVEKIRLRTIPVARCLLHVRWTVPVAPEADH